MVRLMQVRMHADASLLQQLLRKVEERLAGWREDEPAPEHPTHLDHPLLQRIISYWHEVSLEVTRRDCSKKDRDIPDRNPTQPGPCYTARALAIVHLAMYDGLIGITREADTYLSYEAQDLPQFPGAHAA
jgi:hypothetical protein